MVPRATSKRVSHRENHREAKSMPKHGKSTRFISLAAIGLLALVASPRVRAQDLLRRSQQQQQPPTSRQQSEQDALSSLANIQLPPQLAALSPQQLHQLAQLREMQLQQEAQQRQQQPTAQPATSSSSGQIPQPAAAPSSSGEDSGAYNESGSEMEGVTLAPGGARAESNDAQPPSGTGAAGGSSSQPTAPTFEVNWNKCPQLEPSESEKTKKTQVITKCLQAAPIPSNLTRENVEAHREQIATCALKMEGWFDDAGAYKYEKAESEIRAKKLEAPIEMQVLKFHVACKDEANKKFPKDQNKLIDQVQFYQACMDYYISIVCEIEVSVDQ